MNDKYYFKDLEDAGYALYELGAKTEEMVDAIIKEGASLSGFEGKIGTALRERFTIHYTRLKEELVSCRENAITQIENAMSVFSDVEFARYGVIHISKLDDNSLSVQNTLENLQSEMGFYNSTLSDMEQAGISLDRMSISKVQNKKEEIVDFNEQLKLKLIEANLTASMCLSSIFTAYEALIPKVVGMFDVDVQTQLMTRISSFYPPERLTKIEEEVKTETAKVNLERNLRYYKEKYMEELFISTDEDYEAFIKRQLENFDICNEYQKFIDTDYDSSLTSEENLEIISQKSYYHDVLFLTNPDLAKTFTVGEREQLLAELKRNNGKISNEFISKMLGSRVDDSCSIMVEGEYLLSSRNSSMQAEAKKYDIKRLNNMYGLYELYLTGVGIKLTALGNNPPATTKHLDPIKDKGEYESVHGVGKGTQKSLNQIQVEKSKDPPNPEKERQEENKNPPPLGNGNSENSSYPQYSGKLEKVPVNDIKADKLAERLNGQSSMKFSNDPDNREFDVVSDLYIGQTKKSASSVGSAMRNQMKATFEASINNGKTAYFHYDTPPAQKVIDELNRYAKRYGVDYVLDLTPLD